MCQAQEHLEMYLGSSTWLVFEPKGTMGMPSLLGSSSTPEPKRYWVWAQCIGLGVLPKPMRR